MKRNIFMRDKANVDYSAVKSIKVLGSGCKSCHSLYMNAQEAARKAGIDIEVEYITDMEKIMEYGVMQLPVLVINERVAAQGRVLKAEEILKLMR